MTNSRQRFDDYLNYYDNYPSKIIAVWGLNVWHFSRAAVVRGQVITPSGMGLIGVRVSTNGASEGFTMTRFVIHVLFFIIIIIIVIAITITLTITIIITIIIIIVIIPNGASEGFTMTR